MRCARIGSEVHEDREVTVAAPPRPRRPCNSGNRHFRRTLLSQCSTPPLNEEFALFGLDEFQRITIGITVV